MTVRFPSVRVAASSLVFVALVPTVALAATDAETIKVFQNAGQSGRTSASAYGYAVFPTIGKGGIGVGGAHGTGRVYEQGKYVGDTTMTQVTRRPAARRAGLQRDHLLRGQARVRRIHGRQLRVRARAVGRGDHGRRAAAAGTDGGATAGASGGKNDATTAGGYYKGMAIFTVAKGGLMYEATIGGQKFKYTPKKK